METQTLVTWAVVMLGAMMQGMTGLGFALVSVPVLMMFQDARSVIVTILMLSTLLNAVIFFQARHEVTLKDAGLITLGSVLGVPFGSYLLTALSAEALKMVVAALVLTFSVPLLMGYTRSFGHPRAVSLVTGTVSGALQGSVGMGGPPVALLMASQGVLKESFRGTLVLRSMAASSLSVLALVPSGLINLNTTTHALLLVPALLAGFLLGNRLLDLVPQPLFKKITVLLVAGTAVISLVGSVL